jgi:serine protease AprX
MIHALVISLALFAAQAQAGEILRLKASGAIKPSGMVMTASRGDLFIVQWKGAITESEKAALRNEGLSLISYIPDDAFLVKGSPQILERVQDMDFVRVILPYSAEFKLEPELTRNGIFAFSDRVLVSVQTLPGANISAHFSSVKSAAEGLFVGETSVSSLWDLAKRDDVIWIERFLPVSTMEMNAEAMGIAASAPLASTTGYESGTKLIKVDAAYEAGITGAGQVVSFADTGLDSGNISSLIPDFQGQVKSGFAMGLGGKSWGDPQNHGTHVAGSIAGNGKSSNGLIKGAAFEAKLAAQGLWSDILNNIAIPGIPKLFDKANSEGARIHSNSWGAPNSNGRYDNFCVQADTWLFANQDFLAVFAAGNDGGDMNKDGVIDEGTVSSPGSSKNVLTVGASKNYLLEGGIQRKLIELRPGKEKWSVEPLASSMLSEDGRGMAAFSSRGPAADGRIKPEIVAPGTNIVAARSKHPKAKPEDSWGSYDDNYLFMGGTSMSTPITSGAMVLVRQHLLKLLNVSSVSSALLKATVANTAEDLFPGQFGERARGQEQPTRRPNNHEGWGRVDLEALVKNQAISFHEERAGLATNQEKTYSVEASAGRALKVTLAYTDAPAVAAAAKTLVNDLDLTVTDPSGRVFYPNGKSGKDNVNNMEQIDILAPVAGAYKISVKGANIPQGKNGAQPFALVISR